MLLPLLLNLGAAAPDVPSVVSLGGGKKPRLREDLLQVPDWREEFRLARVRRSNEAVLAVVIGALTTGMLDG